MAGTPIFTIEPNPHWVIIDNFSKLPDGAAIYTYRSLDPSTFKPAFQDAGGLIPYGQPIVGFGNGTMPPIFWEFDPNNPTDTYYIRVYDSADPTTQQFLWDFNGLSGGGSGGGGTVVTVANTENLVVNNILYRNIGNITGSPSLPTALTIAPSNNAGYVNDTANINVTNNGPVGGDIIFAKNNSSATDKLSFKDFTPLGVNALPGGESTPEQYLEYECTAPGAAETYKYVQFPISLGVQSLSQQPVSMRIYARCNSGNTTLKLFWRQFYGSGGAPSADQIVQIGANLTLNNTWQVFTVNVLVPDATGHTRGTCRNDALFLQVVLPMNTTTNIDFIKSATYLGSMGTPKVDYVSNDEVDSIVSKPRTGDIRISDNLFQPFGWVLCNDGVISNGDPTIVAPVGIPVSLNSVQTYALYSLLWPFSPSFIPIYDNVGAISTRGASATADFTAGKQLSLTKVLGRALSSAGQPNNINTGTGVQTPFGTSFGVGQPNIGEQSHTMLLAELVPHVHPAKLFNSAGATPNFSQFNTGGAQTSTGNTDAPTGALATPFNVIQPTSYWNVFLKL